MYRALFCPRPLIGALVFLCLAGAAAAAPSASTAPRCATSGLVVWLNTQGDGAAGSSYYTLEFTNLSGHMCTLTGYPGVSAVDLSGHQLGSAASHNPAHASKMITVPPGGTRTSVLRIVEAGNFTSSDCHLVLAAGLRVYPPNQTAAKVVPFPFDACSLSGPGYLSIEPVQ